MKPFSVNTTKVTLWAGRAAALIVFVLLFTLPALLDWYCQFRVLMPVERTALTLAFYACAVIIFFALWNMDRLLLEILDQQVFTRDNVRRIRRITYCCAGICGVCIPASLCYYPLIFLVLVMGFLSLAVSVVCRVMDAAVSLREENDLTI